MAHFARLDENNTVINVEVVNNDVLLDENGVEQETLGVEFLSNLYGGGWYKQTSYNGSFRKKFAGLGDYYDSTKDAFIPPKPFDSWILDPETYVYFPPVAHPNDGEPYIWDEETINWIKE